jgi:hypothetical protein
VESHDDLIPLFERDLFGKPVSTFPDHALAVCWMATEQTGRMNRSIDPRADLYS